MTRLAAKRMHQIAPAGELTDAQLEVLLWTSETVALAGGEGPCTMAKPGNGKNWIEEVHGRLPNYICHVAKAIQKAQGYDTGRAIAAAISRIKKWIASPSTKADTKAKASKAVAEWEALKASAHAKAAAK